MKETMTLAAEDLAVEPATRRFLEAVSSAGGPPIYTLAPAEARAVLERAQAGDVPRPAADLRDLSVPGGPRGPVSVRLVRPRGVVGPLPVIVYLHGGGWILGSKSTHDRLAREIAHRARATVLFVNYSPAPEAKYPTQLEEAYAVTRWAAANGPAIDSDGSRLAVAGDSAGGNLAAAVTLLAKERGGPKIDFQALFYPVTDASFDTGSYRQFAEGLWLSRAAMEWFWNAYIPDERARARATASPLRASLEELRGLPPALVITGEYDVLRDEGEAYGHRLAEAGVTVTQLRYLGTIHDFLLLDAIRSTPAVLAALSQAGESLRAALARPGESS